MKDLTIRKYVPAQDRDALLELLRLNTPTFFHADEEEDFLFYLKYEYEDFFVITKEGKVIGCGGINYDEKYKNASLSWDIYHPDEQNMGIEEYFLKYRLDFLAKEQKISKIIIRTSQYVCPFYEKNGFKLLKTIKDYWAEGFDLCHLEYQGDLTS